MTTYRDELTKAMALLAENSRTVFMGQAVAYPGTGMTDTLRDVPRGKLLELPVAEDFQMGMAIGMSLAGFVPVCIYPRINFLLLAMNQLVLHLDALPRFSEYRPKVIIRTAVATPEPLNPGPQHLGDFTVDIQGMLSTVNVTRLHFARNVVESYRVAMERNDSTLLVEYVRSYDDE